MSIIGWIVLGLIAGFIASKIVDARGQGLMLDLVLGIGGASSAACYSASSVHQGLRALTSTA